MTKRGRRKNDRAKHDRAKMNAVIDEIATAMIRDIKPVNSQKGADVMNARTMTETNAMNELVNDTLHTTKAEMTMIDKDDKDRCSEPICLIDTAENEGLQWEKFPIECLPLVLRDYCVAVARSTRTDPTYVATFTLPVVSSAVGSHIVLQATQDWQVPAIIWSLVVADSGSGKTPSWRCAIKPLMQRQREYRDQYEIAMKQYEIDMKKWKRSKDDQEKPEQPKHRFCHISDTTIAALIPLLADNPYGVCASYNEASTWIGSFSHNGKDEGIYCHLFDGISVQINRKTGTRYIGAHHTNTSICGGIQPNSFYGVLQHNPQFEDSGFLARFLLCQPPDVPRYFGNEAIPEPIAGAYHQLFDTLAERL